MSSRYAAPRTFLDVYNHDIAPKLREIDVFLKERESPITLWQVSQLLDMPYNEVKNLIHNLKIETLNHENFFYLIMSGTSRICRLIQRETKMGSPIYYTPDDISVIYGINLKNIVNVFDALGVSKVKEDWLPFIFENIPADGGTDS